LQGISSNEALLLKIVENSRLIVFGPEEIVELGAWNRTAANNALSSLCRKGIIVRIKRGSYALERDMRESRFSIATELVKPSYISFWTALSDYGFTEQQVSSIQLVSTKQVPDFKIGDVGVEVVALKPARFYGYVRNKDAVMAEPEKALVDALFRPDLCGGVQEVAKCLRNAWPQIDEEILTEYTLRFENRALNSRIGYLIERLGLKWSGAYRLLAKRSLALVPLEGSSRKGRAVARWRVIENIEIAEEDVP
jgi:predicted transcriptional regulator of viral defense system